MDYFNLHKLLIASLQAHLARLRASWDDSERGASAVELALITVVIIAIAGVVLLAIRTFVTNQSNTIANTNP